MSSKQAYGNQTDEELFIKVQQNEFNAFEELYERYGKRVEYFFYRMLWGDREKAVDFSQELFTKVLEKKHLFNPEKRFKTWLFSIANNLCKNDYRKNETQQRAHLQIVHSQQKHALNGGEQNNDRQTFFKSLYACLEEEDEQKKAAFLLKYIEELPVKEISAILSIPEGTVKSGLHYTSKKLAKKLNAFKSM